MYPNFRISHPSKEGTFQASKWLCYRVLLDAVEMESLFSTLPVFNLYNVSEIVTLRRAIFSHDVFLHQYASYIAALKQGSIYQPPNALFSSAISTTPDTFYAMNVKQGFILKLLQPVIQLSLHHFTYTPDNHSFHFMVHSQESIQWGLQISYPQLYANSVQGDVIEVMKDRSYPNTTLFRVFMKWLRNFSRPAAFLIEGKKIYIKARIGNSCFNWIKQHPQLKEKGLMIV